MSGFVRVERSDGLASITLARPERRNALTGEMYAALAQAIDQAAGDPSVRAITFAGEGPDFTAGNDLADFVEARPSAVDELPVWRFLSSLATCETPLIAAVHGNCVGIGTTMLFHCDLVVADEGARFSMPFVDLGVVPEAGSTLLLPRLGGRRPAARYLLLAEPFGCEEALSMGLISHRAPAGELERTLNNLVGQLLAKPAGALRATQQLLRCGDADTIVERMALESRVFSERLRAPETIDAITAFFERRRSGA